MVSNEVSISGYQIKEELYNGSRTLVYRGYRKSDSLPVVIKLLKNAYPSFNELVQFRNQYAIAKNLNYPGIIQTYGLEIYNNGYVLVMEDFGGISLKDYFNNLETLNKISFLTEFLQVAIYLCDILGILYQQIIIHKDIKPANILINPETKQVKLIDFSIASLLNKETQEIKSPNVLEGTLSYISPEQTGRMNRGIDYRSDFYSLGVTFYELLTGELPFISDDAMELLHCHIAKKPPELPHPNPLLVKERGQEIDDSLSTGKERGLEIPQVLNDIVMKLMAKNAEDRYQSVLGLKHDLETCLSQLKATGKIENFEIASKDICDRFIIPDKLYGRENEVKKLLAAFDRVSDGNSEIMLVAGFSGIGKTAVVNEVQKPIVKQRGYFIKGKFDQFNRNIPLSAFVEAFRDLMKQLISESDSQINQWKSKILAALGENGQVIIDVVPELEKIIGKQPQALELSGNAAQNRFNLLFQKFIQVFTTKEHPLVIFLDDLQWADSASLTLVKLLMNDSKYLMMLGAYRDNEVSSAHPFVLTVEELKKAEVVVNKITLPPLVFDDTNNLVADTLNCSQKLAKPLTELIIRKTKGNPFFTTQFLKALHEEKQITFNFTKQYWECDIAQVSALSLTEDVVEFMGLQLQKLPESTQNILKLAACIGNQFDLETLAIVSEQSQTQTAADLWKALQEGLILPQSDIYKFYLDSDIQNQKLQESQVVNYKFLHDRVQQAAYSLIPDDQKKVTHYDIGQLFYDSFSETEREERIFDIVNQLNIGIDLITEQSHRNRLAKLNLLAGSKAKNSTAYNAAVNYLTLGINLLPPKNWENDYDLTLALYDEAAEAAYLSANFEQMDKLVKEIHNHAKNILDEIKVYEVEIQAYMARDKFIQAIQTGLKVLKCLDICFPEAPNQSDIQQGIENTFITLAQRKPSELVNIPIMSEPSKLAALRIINSIVPCAYQVAPQLLPLLVMEQVNLSIKYGNSHISASGYAMWALVLCGIVGDVIMGYEFGQLALSLLERFNSKEVQAETIFIVNSDVKYYREPVKATLLSLQSAYSIALETGNLSYAGLATYIYGYYAYLSGKNLQELNQEITRYNQVIHQYKQENSYNLNLALQQIFVNLLNQSEDSCNFDGQVYNYSQMLPLHKQNNDATAIFYIYFNKQIISYLFGYFDKALENAKQTEKYLFGVTGNLAVPVFFFYDSLIQLAAYIKSTDKTDKTLTEILNKVETNQAKMQEWANNAPMNFQHKVDLVEAEKYRVLGQKIAAIEYYDKAIFGAKENEYIQEEALANELTAKFYLDWGKEKVASSYMQEAYYCYARWGSLAKTDDLEKRYPNLLRPILQPVSQTITPLDTITSPNYSIHHSTSHRSSSSTSINQILDFSTVIKASQTISRTIDLDELIKTLTRMMLENSGADKCALLLSEDKTWQVRAIATLNSVKLQTAPVEDNSSIPTKLIQYVKGTQESVVIDNLQTNLPVIDDYLNQYQPKSVLCLPILNQGQLIGILYLENDSTSCVFTKDRISVLDFLCTQAAISLENAYLYSQQQQKNQEIAQKEIEYRSIFENVSDGLSITDLDTGKIIASNPTYCQIYGYTQAEFFDLTPADFIHPDYIYLFGEYLASLKSGKEFYTQCVGKRKNDSYFDVEVKAVPFMYKGKIHGLNIIRDISEQKAAKKALEDTNALLNSLLETIPDVFFAKDLQGKYIAVNANLAKLFNKSISEIIGKYDTELFSPEFGQSVMLKDQEIMTQGITETCEEVLPNNGINRTFLTIKTPLQDSTGNITGLIGLTRDITDRKTAEEAVIKKSQQLEKALKDLQHAQLQIVQNEKMSALGNLVAGVAHEMNNPLGFISASLKQAKPTFDDIIEHLKLYQESLPEPDEEILEHAEEIDLDYSLEDLPKMIDSMVMACDRLKNISTSLRTFSRADKDYKVAFNIHEGIDSTILILKHRLKANEQRPAIEVITNYADLPKIQCFPGQLNQVFMNILANAIDALEEFNTGRSFEEIKINPNQIIVKTLVENSQVKILITDNGKGMSEETQNKIFDHLFTTKEVGKGTGLGLAIAKQIIEEKHGGNLEVTSELGQGTCFCIQLPIIN
ncbi:multi-sensor signal transduction multi-kinase [Calothrix parasitica NIES-267]|uniref:histidine kinase n=1 Tax=Calothrix parasitica NIES-267 TaxID=1973488 RepID=A0A1Z4LW84_9CYAN|nr:multi-sensor signal transduction multi-kinase [Calothrix parasitica NIES-267]